LVISGIIGMGIFANSGRVIHTAGPGGAILTYGLVGFGVIAIMECIAEMIAHWPIANCMMSFVASFVDQDFATIVGIAYWYARCQAENSQG
jgi:amino acid transporter